MNSKDKLLSRLIAMNIENKSCGLRFLIKKQNESFLENTCLTKSHYLIFEKSLI